MKPSCYAPRAVLVIVLSGLALIGISRAAMADVTYDYVGQPFVKYLTPCVNHTYDCVDGNISGSITLDVPPNATGKYSGEHVTAFSVTASGTGLTAKFSRTSDGNAYDELLKHWYFKLDQGWIREWAFFAAFKNGAIVKSPPQTPPEQFFLSNAFPGDQSKNGRTFGHTEVSLTPLMGTWTERVTPSADISLTEATTLDAKSVNIKYSVNRPDLNSVHFNVYRCYRPILENACRTRLISTRDLSVSLDGVNPLQQGKHSIKLLEKADLIPDTAAEFIIVVALPKSSTGNQTSSVYFRKWMLGAVTHGFGLASHVGSPFAGLPDWENEMAEQLKLVDKYDDVISFDWIKTSGDSKPGMVEKAGRCLAMKIIAWIHSHASAHRGDVVDVHLIGHSRGAVVVSQALQQLASSAAESPQMASLYASAYLEATLLDPHPANNFLETPWASHTPNSMPYHNAKTFQRRVADPQVVIPNEVQTVDVWWQHTDIRLASSLSINMNLFGLTSRAALNTESVLRTDHDITSHTGSFVGHSDVPLVYIRDVVDSGRLNHSLASP